MNRKMLRRAIMISLSIFCASCFAFGAERIKMSDVFTPDEIRAYAGFSKAGKTSEAVFRKRIDFLERKLSHTAKPDQIAFIKLYLAGQYASLHDFDKAWHFLEDVKAMTNTSDYFQRQDARVTEILLYQLQAAAAETEPEFLRLWNKAVGLGEECLKEFKEKGWETEYLSQLHRSAQAVKNRCYSPDGRFLPFSERKRMQEEALKKEREKREQEAKRGGAPGGSGLTSGTLTKGGLRPAAAASGGCGCGSDQPTSATKSVASCGGCGSGGASPKPASSSPGGGCGCGSAQPTTATEPAAKPAESTGGCGCGSAQAGKQSAASSGGCGGCGSD